MHIAIIALAIGATLVAMPAAGDPGGGLSFLLGDWSGNGSGEPGKGVGGFSFVPDLQNRVIVRRAHSEYPAAAGRPATVHDDLMVVYANESRAVYFDNEGHVIHYGVKIDAPPQTATFLSTDPLPAPLFRLTYRQTATDQLSVAFEISPSGKPEDLKQYVSGAVIRQKPTRP